MIWGVLRTHPDCCVENRLWRVWGQIQKQKSQFLGQGSSSKNSENWLNSGYNLKEPPKNIAQIEYGV